MTNADYEARCKNIRDTRNHLRMITRPRKGDELIAEEVKQQRERNLLSQCPRLASLALDRMIKQRGLTTKQLHALRNLFYMLSFNSPLRNIIPLGSVKQLKLASQRVNSDVMDIFSQNKIAIG